MGTDCGVAGSVREAGDYGGHIHAPLAVEDLHDLLLTLAEVLARFIRHGSALWQHVNNLTHNDPTCQAPFAA